MPRTSAFKGTWEENRRPHIVLAPDAYVAIQGQTSVVTCGECFKKVDLNKYVTGISTEASVDSPPGSAIINLSIPDTDINEFFVEGHFVIIPMMELEVFAKGYYTVGGVPQYYRIFWGMVISITKNWSNGVTTYTLNCKDILHWWEKTNVILNPAFVGREGASCGYQLFGNQYAGLNPYTIIIALARESMGDFSITDGSFMSYKPEAGPEEQVIGQYAKDIMAYWQLKFGNIWNSLVLYGTSGTAYTFEGSGDVSPTRASFSIFKREAEILSENQLTENFKVQPHEIAAFKLSLDRAGDFQFFQNDTQSKLSVAMTARDQIQYEFYCDTTGDIIFKPPFYNLNVIPNKPVSWIQDFEIIDDSINDSEAEVVTHMTSSGNAFGGVFDPCITDEITVPRTGVIDWHLLKRYGWRRQDFQCEWAGNPKKLFWFLLDMMDRINAKRHNGTVTIPMRPEIRMGFPVWIPYYDSFFYVNGVSHNFTPGGQATTTLTLVAKRSKFIAPAGMGTIRRVAPKPNAGGSTVDAKDKGKKDDKPQSVGKPDRTYEVSFEGSVGQTAGLGLEEKQDPNTPLIIRDPNTGKILGYPNVVMVYRTTYSEQPLAKTSAEKGNAAGKSNSKDKKPLRYTYDIVVRETFQQLKDDRKASVMNRIRHHRYEAGMSNAGLYDYAVDVSGDFREMTLIPIKSITWGPGTDDPSKSVVGAAVGDPKAVNQKNKSKGGAPGNQAKPPPAGSDNNGLDGAKSAEEYAKQRNSNIDGQISERRAKLDGPKGKPAEGLSGQLTAKGKELTAAKTDLDKTIAKNNKGRVKANGEPIEMNAEEKQKKARVDALQAEYDAIKASINTLQGEILRLSSAKSDFRLAEKLSVSVRPVSDEFGFEVIGHNRYGRGVFIDRNQLRLKFKPAGDESEVNQINIQFSAVGGMLTTDAPANIKDASSAVSAETFERMQPEDWVTGAAMHKPNEVTLTSVNTFASSVGNAISLSPNAGAVYIEADATRRSKTLWELQPVMVNGLDPVGFPECSCTIGRFQWFSVLPKNVLQEILAPSQTKVYGSRSSPYLFTRFVYINAYTGEETMLAEAEHDRYVYPEKKKTKDAVPDAVKTVTEKRQNQKLAIYQRKDPEGNVSGEFRIVVAEDQTVEMQYDDPPPGAQIISSSGEDSAIGPTMTQSGTGVDDAAIGVTTFPDFFDRLNAYLAQKFNDAFRENQTREEQDVGSDLGFFAEESGEDSYLDPDSVLGPSGGSLFDRASNGDIDALNALQNQINWDWSSSEKALEDLNKTAGEAGDRLAALGDQFKEWAQEWSDADKAGTLTGFRGVETSGGGGKPQPQPFTPPPFKVNAPSFTDPFLEVPQTTPTEETAHTSGETPPSPPAPKSSL